MVVRATGQITLSDLNDAKQLILYLNSNYKTQIYDPNGTTYNPNFTTSNLVITPELYVAGGNGGNMLPSAAVKSLFWYEGSQTTTPLTETGAGTTPSGLSYTLPTGAVGTTAKPLTIKSNLTSTTSQMFTCVITYLDPDLQMETTIKANVDIVKIVNGAAGTNGTDAYYLNLWAPSGDAIRNSNGNLTLKADMYKGAGSVTPSAYQWYIQDPTATVGGGGDADGGAGWRRINNVADPTAAPTLALSANASSQLAPATYYVKYTWCGLSGETIGSAQASLAVTAGNELKVTIPAFAANVTMAKVYIGTVSGTLFYAGDITTSAGNLIVKRYDNSAEPIPTASSTSMNVAQITIRNWAIPGVKGFKCVTSVAGTSTKFTAVIVVRDFQDPLVVNIIGTNVFKNGQGSLTLNAQLIQAGLVISSTGYTFGWSLYKPDGGLIKTYPAVTGDQITVPSTDVDATANLVVDASK